MKWKKYLFFLFLSFTKNDFCLAEDYITLLTHTYPPYVLPDGKQGIAIDIATLLFQDSNLSYTIENYPLPRALLLAEITPNYCVFPVQRTQEREVKYKWVSPILISNSAAVSLADNKLKFRVLADIQDKQLGVQRGSADEEYLNNIKRSFRIDPAGSELQNIKKLDKKRIDIWITDTLASTYYQTITNIKLQHHFIFRTTLRALACHIDTPNSVIKKLSERLKTLYKTGLIKQIVLKHTQNSNHSTKLFGHDMNTIE